MIPRRAGWPSLLLFGVAVAGVILLTGPLLLFFPPVVAFEQARQDVPALLDTDQATVDRATASMLGDLLRNGDFTVSISPSGEPVLDAKERSHMRDVGGVVRGLILAAAVAWLLAVLLWWRLRNDPGPRARAMLAASAGIGVAAVVLGAFFALAFDAAFAAFHAIFFAAGTWTFGPDSNLLRFFPQPLWFELALLAGATIVISALLVAWAARRTLAREST
ncbi:MAG TPA: DUF1461 domain-containing protein [Candidatus Limnocylindria bacterium]|nr:DUF1461 domain-containing protein [Candidatus Limnocylindria bacterium]